VNVSFIIGYNKASKVPELHKNNVQILTPISGKISEIYTKHIGAKESPNLVFIYKKMKN
jgi:hypothetical protein